MGYIPQLGMVGAAKNRWLNQSGQLPQITPPQTPSAVGVPPQPGQVMPATGPNGQAGVYGERVDQSTFGGGYAPPPTQAGLQAPANPVGSGVVPFSYPNGQPPTAPAAGGLPPGYSTQGGTLAGFSAPGVLAPFTQGHDLDPRRISESPAYQFRMGEGLQAIDRSAAAKGTLLTGGTLKDAMTFGQGLASTEYDNEWNRGFQQQGQNADIWNQNANRTINGLSSVSQQGLGATAGAGNALVGAGNALAGGTRGSASAANAGVGAVAGTLGEIFAKRRAQKQVAFGAPGSGMPIDYGNGPGVGPSRGIRLPDVTAG